MTIICKEDNNYYIDTDELHLLNKYITNSAISYIKNNLILKNSYYLS